jgi:hypothetical protein
VSARRFSVIDGAALTQIEAFAQVVFDRRVVLPDWAPAAPQQAVDPEHGQIRK